MPEFHPTPNNKRFKNLTGSIFHWLTVQGYAGHSAWHCLCKCGERRIVLTINLRNGSCKSCGCYGRSRYGVQNIKHGMFGTPIYKIWSAMKDRCSNPKHPAFKHYGGRGITICERWSNSFLDFYADMGDKPSDKSIDRIDNEKGYYPGNCRWATTIEQARNRRGVLHIEWRGVTKTIPEWCDELGLNRSSVHRKIKAGWGVDDTFFYLSTLTEIRRGRNIAASSSLACARSGLSK